VIRIVEGDLAQQRVSAVLRPADEHLAPLGETSLRLDQAGGARLTDLRRTQAPLEVGSAVITGGGGLPAEFVLHLVVHGEERAASPETVRRALASAWHRAEAWELQTIAASVDGLGGPVLSVDEGARMLVESFRKRPANATRPGELCIVVRNDNERSAVSPWLPAL
jgi:O-acetyl-ADP-ribose deacetylase (regulator of RNase III)